MIRIDTSRDAGDRLLMRMAGTVAESTVAVLRDAVAHHGVPHHLDLSEVEFVDADGASTILDLEARGAVVVGARPYIDLLLRTPTTERKR